MGRPPSKAPWLRPASGNPHLARPASGHSMRTSCTPHQENRDQRHLSSKSRRHHLGALHRLRICGSSRSSVEASNREPWSAVAHMASPGSRLSRLKACLRRSPGRLESHLFPGTVVVVAVAVKLPDRAEHRETRPSGEVPKGSTVVNIQSPLPSTISFPGKSPGARASPA